MYSNPTQLVLLATRGVFKSNTFHILGSSSENDLAAPKIHQGFQSVCSPTQDNFTPDKQQTGLISLSVCMEGSYVVGLLWYWYVALLSSITFIFLLKLHIHSALCKPAVISVNMQNCVHRPLYGCPVMYFWDMQIWHFSSVIALQSLFSLPFSLSLSHTGRERWDITC